MEKQKPVVAYYYDEESGNYCYTVNHPWRPHRSKLVHNLVTGYNLEKEMIVHRPRSRTFEEITEFHADGESSRGSAVVSKMLFFMSSSTSCLPCSEFMGTVSLPHLEQQTGCQQQQH